MLSTILEEQSWPAGERKIILTFDDGPNPDKKISEAVLDTLAKHGVKSTFFYIGKNIERQPDVIRRVLDEGHNIGLHTYSHTLAPILSSRILFKETDRTCELLQTILEDPAYTPQLFRSPWGIVTPAVSKLLTERKLNLAYLTFFINEAWAGKTSYKNKVQQFKDALMKHEGGAIVMHENCDSISIDKSWLPDALEELISWSVEEGFSFTNYKD